MNVLTVVGNLGKDCEVRQAGSTTVCNFSVAFTSGVGDRQETHWLRCALWGKRAESRLTDYLVKGQKVAVSGELSTRDYEGKTYLECRVNDVTLCGDKGSVQSAPQPAPSQPKQMPAPSGSMPEPIDDFEDDIPFN